MYSLDDFSSFESDLFTFMKLLATLLILLITWTCNSQLSTPGSGVTDVDGNVYPTIILNGQEWMAQNLNTSKYSDGSLIANLVDSTSYVNTTFGAWSYYNHDVLNETLYGKLYNWYTVVDNRNVCPADWHVPSDQEWKNFVNFLDPSANGGLSTNSAGGLMKSTGTLEAGTGYWVQPNSGATNESGFSALPGGQRNDDNSFYFQGSNAYFWSTNAIGQNNAIFYILFSANASLLRSNFRRTFGMSVRCVKNQSSGIIELDADKVLVKIVDALGREIQETSNAPMIFIYSDGSREHVFKVE